MKVLCAAGLSAYLKSQYDHRVRAIELDGVATKAIVPQEDMPKLHRCESLRFTRAKVELMPDHEVPIIVRFHGGFLDGHTSRSGEVATGKITDFWNADAVYYVTLGKTGVAMSGVSPDGWRAMQTERGSGVETIAMDQVYRVTGSRVEDETLVIDVAYEAGK